MKQLKLYQIDMKYIRDLHNADNRVPSVSPQIGKHTRIFVGIVVTIAIIVFFCYIVVVTKRRKH